jgi:hypothetical protein
MQLAEKKRFDGTLAEGLASIRTDLENRLQKLRAQHGARKAKHTFSLGAWHNDQTEIYDLTNYEGLGDGENLLDGDEVVKVVPLPRPQDDVALIARGTMPPSASLRAIRDAIKTNPVNHVLARCIKVVRDVAYRGGNPRGTVGAAAQWAVVGPKREDVRCGLDAVGGRVAQEPPNIIKIHARSHVAGSLSVGFGDPQGTSGMLFKEGYSYAVAGDGSQLDIAHFDPVKKQPVFSEPACGVCGFPWPASHRFCEVCLHDEQHARGKKQRRKQ